MNKEVVKKGVEAAEQELREKQIQEVKNIVVKTLEKLKTIEEQIKELESERKILRMDIDDLKEGRLDRIEERQKADVKAKQASVVEIVKEVHHHHYDWWNNPYRVIWHTPIVKHYTPPIVFGNCTAAVGYGTTTTNSGHAMMLKTDFDVSEATPALFTINASIAKNNVIGSYVIDNKPVHLR